jgi:hypothetical protein
MRTPKQFFLKSAIVFSAEVLCLFLVFDGQLKRGPRAPFKNFYYLLKYFFVFRHLQCPVVEIMALQLFIRLVENNQSGNDAHPDVSINMPSNKHSSRLS